MTNRTDVLDIIYGALRSLNTERADTEQIALAPETKLFGPDASLDSLSLVSVIVDVESGVGDRYGKPVSLTDDEAMSQAVSPFSTVDTLANYIIKQMASV